MCGGKWFPLGLLTSEIPPQDGCILATRPLTQGTIRNILRPQKTISLARNKLKKKISEKSMHFVFLLKTVFAVGKQLPVLKPSAW